MQYAVAMIVFTTNRGDERKYQRTHYIPATNRDHAEQIAQALGDTPTITENGPFLHEHVYEVVGVVHGPSGIIRLSISDMEMIASEITAPRIKAVAAE